MSVPLQHIIGIVHFGHACNVRLFGWHASQRPHNFVTPKGTPLPLPHQALTKHEWGAFLANVGQVRSKLSTSHTRHWKQSLAGLALPRGQTTCSGYSPTIIMLRIHLLILKNANKFRWLSLSGGSSSLKIYNIFIFHFFCVYIKRLFLFLNKRIVFCIEHN